VKLFPVVVELSQPVHNLFSFSYEETVVAMHLRAQPLGLIDQPILFPPESEEVCLVFTQIFSPFPLNSSPLFLPASTLPPNRFTGLPASLLAQIRSSPVDPTALFLALEL